MTLLLHTDQSWKAEPESIVVGKDIIEILTSGMYVSPITIYREYVQNAADSIDAARAAGLLTSAEPGTVSITIDQPERSVRILDNGVGIGSTDAARILLAIGASPKRQQLARGFRGVGRLSGLAYCQSLEFRAKAAGESIVTSVAWDCTMLRRMLADPHSPDDLRQLIGACTSCSRELSANPSDHFFEVRLRGLSRHKLDTLLNENSIHHYLAQVAPVPFSEEFSAGNKIGPWLKTHGLCRYPLTLSVGGTIVVRPYRDECNLAGNSILPLIKDIDFHELHDVDGQVGAVAWVAHHAYVRSLPSGLGIRGLRVRLGDIQIGEESLLQGSFREPRFNSWAIGEVHAVDRRLTPNARRDDFELNHHYYNFLSQVAPIASMVSHRCRQESIVRNARSAITAALAHCQQGLKAKRLAAADASRLRALLEKSRQNLPKIPEAERSLLGKQIERIEKRLTRVRPNGRKQVIAVDEALALVSRIITNHEQRRKLLKALEAVQA